MSCCPLLVLSTQQKQHLRLPQIFKRRLTDYPLLYAVDNDINHQSSNMLRNVFLMFACLLLGMATLGLASEEVAIGEAAETVKVCIMAQDHKGILHD